jgi:hypothetical protein
LEHYEYYVDGVRHVAFMEHGQLIVLYTFHSENTVTEKRRGSMFFVAKKYAEWVIGHFLKMMGASYENAL